MFRFKEFFMESQEIDTALKKRGLKRGGSGYPIGKVIGGAVYVHKQYESQFPQEDLVNAKAKMPKDFEYHIVKYNPKTKAFSFIKSSDFDTIDEPSVEGGVTVKADETPPKVFGNAGWIYHHKWMWVGDDYKGFNVEESKQRSLDWTSLPNIDKARIGQRKFWNANVIPLLKESNEPHKLIDLHQFNQKEIDELKQLYKDTPYKIPYRAEWKRNGKTYLVYMEELEKFLWFWDNRPENRKTLTLVHVYEI